MAHSLGKFLKMLMFPAAIAILLGTAGTVYAQSARALERANGNSAVVGGDARGAAAAQSRHTAAASDTGRRAVARNPVSAAAAPIALALENSPPPASTPEPLTLALVGGALAGLYGMRRHLN